jgi:glutamyl-tRNA synthetase
MSAVVTRFAPSPTGYLHIGGARTALFSYLLARRHGGRFLLRIEDTDRERSTPEATQAILDAMRWLSLDADEKPIFQSQRFDLYNRHVDILLERGQAYWCACTPQEVEAMRERAMQEGRKPKYDGSCRLRNLGPGPGRVVRFKGPDSGSTVFEDLVKGPIAVDNAELDDMILRRSDGSPTYNLAVVVDDREMGVTHVLRGDDHVANTPRQILLYRAFGWPEPRFGHVPMILGPDKKKLSKRHGALSVMEYERMGYLPEAVVNYLARLGWSHGDQEVFSRGELIALFSTESLGSSAAVFDVQKLDWLNAHYLKQRPVESLLPLLAEFVRREDWGAALPAIDEAVLAAAIPLLAPRAKTLADMARQSRMFLADAGVLPRDAAATQKFLTDAAKVRLRALAERLAAVSDFAEGPIEAAAKAFIEEQGIAFKEIAQPLRVALTGQTASPGLFETMRVLGRERTLSRLRAVLDA